MMKQLTTKTLRKAIWAIAVATIAVGAIAAGTQLSAAGESGSAALGLEGTEWALVSIGDEDVLLDSEITALFNNGQIVGSAGCNNYFAGYVVDGNGITFSPAGMTMMMCPGPDGLMLQETAFASALETAQSYNTTDSVLEIVYDSGSLIFVAN